MKYKARKWLRDELNVSLQRLTKEHLIEQIVFLKKLELQESLQGTMEKKVVKVET